MSTATGTDKLSPNELLKAAHPTLDGTLAQTLADTATDHFSEDDNQFLKFHGTYQQDDRDLRKTGKKYIFMARVRMPGGILKPAQYLAFDKLSSEFANNTLRVTSRQGIQFHGVVKSGLRQTIKAVNDTLLTTLAACGDVVRNVMAPPTPSGTAVEAGVIEDAYALSKSLLPQTPAYHEIWLNGEPLKLNAEKAANFEDPLYGKTYLPRKFKIGFAIPPNNDVDVFTNCLGFIAIEEQGQLVGYNLIAGGGMGRSHGNTATYPRMADVVGYFPRAQVEAVARAVVTIHRDFGDRGNRKHARLKYVLADRGVEWFRQELEQRVGFKLEAARPYKFTRQGDAFGWHRQPNGKWFLGLFVETGRIADKDQRRTKTALREIVQRFGTEVRLTAGNNVLLCGIEDKDRAAIIQLLAEHGVMLAEKLTATRCASMACVALPTCGLALAESERYLPNLMTDIEGAIKAAGLGNEEIIIRMTGCPNGCARPYMAEIGFVGKAPGRYQIYLGGNESATRLNRLYKDNVKDAEIVSELRPLLARFAAERHAGERFGDWTARTIWSESKAEAAPAGV